MNENLILENYLAEATFLNCSDIHFQPQEENVKIFYRINEKIKLRTTCSEESYQKIKRIIKFWSKLDISNSNVPQEGSFIFDNLAGRKFNIRTSIIALPENETIVLRIIYNELLFEMNSMTNNQVLLEKIYQVINCQIGLFIFTGSTGSGKSTTMYSILKQLSIKENKKVITIEDPIEVDIPDIVQLQTANDGHNSYSQLLKAILRQDPDCIMIGEIRDLETAKIVVHAALTGHTVITTMHASTFLGVIERFLDFGFYLSEIEAVLIGITNQKLEVDSIGKKSANYKLISDRELSELFTKVSRRQS